jgi:hypothetical protein
MITGLSLSSQVENLQITKSVIVATPETFNPNTGTERISCSAGNGYYVGDNCACCNIHCSNGNTYTWCVCKDGAVFGGASKHINSNNSPKTIGVPMDITSSVIEDPNTNLDPTARIINIQKIKNAIITIDKELKLEYQDFTLVIMPGEYEVKMTSCKPVAL